MGAANIEEAPESGLLGSSQGDGSGLITDGKLRLSRPLDLVLNNLAMGTAAETGVAFFRSLVRHVATAFDADVALVSEWADQERTRFRSIAHWSNGAFIESTEYPVEGTPCAGVLAGNPACYPQAVSKIFPVHLVEGGFIGVPLKNSEGGVLGHLMVGDNNPMVDSPLGLPALETFAARAAAELVRLQTEQALRASEERYRTLYNQTPVMLHSSDAEGRLTSVSDHWLETLGFERSEVLGRASTDFLTDESRAHAMATCLPRFYRTGRIEGEYLAYRTRKGATVDVLLSAVAEQTAAGQVTGSLVVSVDVTEQMRLEAAIIEISEREQRRLGRDLHDDLGQTLNGIWFMTDRLAAKGAAHHNSLAEPLLKIAGQLQDALSLTRSLARGLHAADLDESNLTPALSALALSVEETHSARSVRCTLDAPGPIRLKNSSSATHLYRITQEAINNALRHGQATDIQISLRQDSQALELRISDNGGGIGRGAGDRNGFGLRIMQYRARTIGGRLHVGPGRPAGTVVSCRIPISIDD